MLIDPPPKTEFNDFALKIQILSNDVIHITEENGREVLINKNKIDKITYGSTDIFYFIKFYKDNLGELIKIKQLKQFNAIKQVITQWYVSKLRADSIKIT